MCAGDRRRRLIRFVYPLWFRPLLEKQNSLSRVCGSLPLLLILWLVPCGLTAQGSFAGKQNPSKYAVSVQQLRVSPKVRTHLTNAIQQFATANLAAAAGEVDRALHIDPLCAQALTLGALVKLALGNTEGALDDATHATKINPSDPHSFLALGTAYNSRQMFKEAESASQEALRLRSDLWQARLELAKALYGQKEYDSALRELNSLGIDFPDVHLVRGNTLMRLGRQHEGIAELADFLSEAPSDPRAEQVKRVVAAAN